MSIYYVYSPDHSCDDPKAFEMLSTEQQAVLCQWLQDTFVGDLSIPLDSLISTTYGLKHEFSDISGFYITNGQFKGALLAVGFPVEDVHQVNWVPRIRRRHPCGVNGCKRRAHLVSGRCYQHEEWRMSLQRAHSAFHRDVESFPELAGVML